MELEESTSVEVNNPGTFPTVCVELGISSLAVNTIIEVHVPTIELNNLLKNMNLCSLHKLPNENNFEQIKYLYTMLTYNDMKKSFVWNFKKIVTNYL